MPALLPTPSEPSMRLNKPSNPTKKPTKPTYTSPTQTQALERPQAQPLKPQKKRFNARKIINIVTNNYATPKATKTRNFTTQTPKRHRLLSADSGYLCLWDKKASFSELAEELNKKTASCSKLINRLIGFDEEMEDISRNDLKITIKNFFDTEIRDELLSRDRFYLALAYPSSELSYFISYYLQQVSTEPIDEDRLWSYAWVQNFEKAYFD